MRKIRDKNGEYLQNACGTSSGSSVDGAKTQQVGRTRPFIGLDPVSSLQFPQPKVLRCRSQAGSKARRYSVTPTLPVKPKLRYRH